MGRALKTLAGAVVLAGALGVADAASAQGWNNRYEPRRSYDFHGQADRPGDFRCDAYWDRGRDDCDAAWRDQRPFATRQRGWGYAPRQGYAHAPAASAYHGAYGRPDLVYPAGGRTGHAGARSPGRIDWCRATYRSYDPHTGYYRAYSGRLVYCG